MPAFSAVGAYVAGTLLGLAGTVATVVGAIVATGAAYITSRVINGNPNKGNNASAGSQGGRIQVAPATNNKIPVLYGSAYVNGMITDARLKSIGGTTNDTMYYCIVLSEYTNNLTASPVYGLESVLWNDLRLTPVDATTNAHKVKDGRKVVDGAIVTAGSFVVGKTYVITKLGTTTQANWNTIAGTSSKVYDLGAVFTCANAGTGTGQAQEEDFIDTNFVVDSNSLVELRVYAGGSDDSNQIYPPQSTGNTANAYTFWANNDGSWTSANEMKGLVFAIVKLTYAGDKGFTGLPNVTFQLSNNVANPADVWYDYMTSQRYGAGIDPAFIDTTAKLAWYNYCEEDITYTNKAGETNQVDLRYQINGIVDTSRQVKTNIDTILQNGGAWMSYNVATGLWSPIIKKAVSAGTATESATLFTASRTGSTLTVTTFPSGRIEQDQLLYNSSGTFIGTISAQLAPTAGETAGQIGRYTTSTTGSISSTTFYTLPASSLEFSDDNIISGITLSSTRLDDLYNEVEAEFYDRYNKDQKAYARTDLPSIQRNPNEPDNQLRFSLDLVNSSIQADILSQLEMRQSRDDLVIEFSSNHYGIQTQAGDVVAVTSDLYGWAPKQFRVMRVKEIEGDDGSLTAQIQALEYNPDVFTIEPITEFSTSANIGIGNLISSVGLPAPTTPVISNKNPDVSVPNFTFSIDIPSTGGPFDEAEIYFAEGWDSNSITGWIDNNSTPGTYSGVAGTIMTVTSVTYNSINPGDYFDLGGVTVVSQLTQTAISTKTFASGGAPGAFIVTLNNVTGVVIGQKPGLNSPAVGIPADAMVIDVNTGTSTVTLDKAFTVQASGNYDFTTAGGTGTYTVNMSVAAAGTDDLYDQPIDSDFSYLKKIVPDGNASSFDSGSTISTTITELPANSQTFRRYFLKARLGVKKNFGSFSPNTPVDLDGNNVSWNPNPGASGGSGLFGNITIAVVNDNTISTTAGDLVLDSATNLVIVDGDLTVTGTNINTGATNTIIQLDRTSSGTSVFARAVKLQATSTGTPAVGFGPAIGFVGQTATSTFKDAGYIAVQATDITSGSEDFEMNFGLMRNGATYVPKMSLYSNADLELANGGSLFLNGSTSGYVALSAGTTPANQTYTLPTAYPASNGYALVSNTSGTLSWATFADTNTTYDFAATSTSGGANLNLTGSDSTTDTVKLTNGGHITAAYTSATAVTLGSDATDANTASAIVSRDGSGNFSASGATLGNITVGITDDNTISTTSSNLVLKSFAGTVYLDAGDVQFRNASGSTSQGSMNYTTGHLEIYNNFSGVASAALWLTNTGTNTNSPTYPLTLYADTTATPTVGFGTGITFNAVPNATIAGGAAGVIECVVTDATTSANDWAFNFDLKNNGAPTATVATISSVGNLDLNGSLALNGTITGATTITAANITATTSYVTGTLSTRVTATATTTSTSAFTLTSSATRNVMKSVVNIVQGSNVHCCEILVLRVDATTAMITIYGEMFNTSKLADFDADVSSGTLRLRVTPTSATSTVFTVLRDSLD